MRANLLLLKLASLAAAGAILSVAAGWAAADVVAVISAKNPVTALSRNQVVDIFLGKSSRFPDGSQAVPIDQAEGSAARDELYTNFAGKSPAQVKAYWSKIIFTGRGQPPRQVPNGVEMLKVIADSPGTIGYIEQSLVDSSVKVLGP